MAGHDPMPLIRNRRTLDAVWNDKRYKELVEMKEEIEVQMNRIWDEYFEKICIEEAKTDG